MVLAAGCRDKPKPPPPTATPVLRAACDRPLPMTLGVSMQGDGPSCYSFDTVTNATLVLEAEIKPSGEMELAVFDPEAKDDPVCKTSITEASAPWGSPKSFECAGFRKTATHQLRVSGKGTYRFTLRPR
jgi:hypothetical protein